ncbi:uncharacterized protein LOC120090875 [Benincasa hispida]|uniref:uncharacterized protein LOC120090875 n=1 Tax=Benincasa hispida TaxID=102211 RepID=UPI0019015239|nr:uncharacterized protein LOC120090875 [Benincasa hispida]
MNTVLVVDDLKFVLMEECPPTPWPNTSQSVRDAYERWTKANDKAKVYILASLFEVLAKKHETMITACYIMNSLCDMFGKPSSQIMHDALTFIFTTRMTEGSSVTEHVLNMTNHFNITEMNRSLINEPNQTFESLMKAKRNNGKENIAFSKKKIFNRGSTAGNKFVPPSSSGVKK